jgi:hypothetical protein
MAEVTELTKEQRAALEAAVDRVLMPLVRGVLVTKLSQVAVVMLNELGVPVHKHNPRLCAGCPSPERCEETRTCWSGPNASAGNAGVIETSAEAGQQGNGGKA